MRTVVTWILSAIVALAFLAAGGFKMTGPAMEVHLFGVFGFPIWSMYAVGIVEIVCAVGLLIPRYAALAATVLVLDMIGALILHLTHGQAGMAPVPLVLGLLSAAIVLLRGGFKQYTPAAA
jgi:uncharacterized membrane protein YphA (DoxX/SURF4 family)